MKSSARIVVIGGGMMGVSLLYHLALDGCIDTILLEKGELTSGSTWHAAGQCPSITGNYNLAKIHAYSNQLYPKLESLTGQYTSWHPCGGLRLAVDERELAWLKQIHGYSKSIGFNMEIVGLDVIRRLNPHFRTDGVLAAAWTTEDGHGDPTGLCNAMAKGARDLGATIVRRNRVLGIARRGTEWIVETEQGSIAAEMVVNAAGCYADRVSAMVGGSAPIINMQHQYIVTHPIKEFSPTTPEIPVMRDSYTSGYFRQEQQSGLIGVYENTDLREAWAPHGWPEWEASNELFADDVERITPWLERAIERMPIFGEAGIRRVINGAIPHTPDGLPLLGPAPGLPNFWMCCGTSFGIAQGGGCGKYLAQWMLQGDSDINMVDFDPRRFGGFAGAEYSRAKVFLDYRLTFTTRLPGEEELDGRPQKTSPLYEQLKAQGAVHTETFGWERPKWFALDGRAEDPSYRRNNVFDVVAEEVRGVHERVGVLDLSGFAKFDVSGKDSERFLDRICANHMPRKVGGIVLTQVLSPNGRIVGEMTVTRLAPDRFYTLSAAAAELRDQDLLRQSLTTSESVSIDNRSEAMGVLVVSGPHSRDLLQTLTATSLANADFRWLTAQEIIVAGQPVRALRVSYVGELGWELHSPMSSISALYAAIWEAGQKFSIVNYGLYAVNSMRIEKAYKAWGSELTNEIDLIEADMSRFIDLTKADFVGKAATASTRTRSLKIVYAELGAKDTDVRGGEPVFHGDRCIGLATSGGYGHRVRRSLFFASVPESLAAAGTAVQVLVQGERRPATFLSEAAFDPTNARMRA